MKIELLDLEFTSEHFYIQKKAIVERIIFNNRTFYSKFEQHKAPLTAILLKQHQNNEISLAVPLIEKGFINYVVIEYQQNDWKIFYSLLKHLLKSLNIQNFQAYTNSEKELFQLFIPRKSMRLDEAESEVTHIKHLLALKSKKSYKIYPNKNIPQNLNIITLPTKKV